MKCREFDSRYPLQIERFMTKIHTPSEVEDMRRALKQKYGSVPDSRENYGIDYDRMSPQEVINNYNSWVSGADDYWSNERR